MMNKKICLLLAVLLLFTGCSKQTDNDNNSNDIDYADTSEMDFEFSNRDLNSEYNSTPIEINDSKVVITKEGTYLLSGNYISVNINVSDNEKVQLVLKNATIENENGCAILIENGDKVFITLEGENKISDGNDYELVVDDSNVDGAIFSKSDLTINGSGSLIINGNLKHGVVSKDDLVIVDSTITVKSNGSGINGKDCVKIKNSTLNIESSSDGIQSDNEEENRGYIYIESGKFDINSGNDGIQAESILKILDGTFNIKTGIGSSGYLNSSEESYKGLKASSDILISNGSFNLDTQDDCIHSNNTLSIENGDFSLNSGDDGIHADSDLIIKDGNIIISKSYEGIEASVIKIQGGNIEVNASDDGLNAAGGNDTGSENVTTMNITKTSTTSNRPGGPDMGGRPNGGGDMPQGGNRPGMGGFENDYGEIYISGGYLYVNASGDGIDSNGILEISGGVTLVSGPTNNGNGALDYQMDASISNGTLIALGSSGMAQSIGSDSQGVLGFTMGNLSANTSLVIADENGNLVISMIGEKSYNCAIVSSPNIKSGKTYTVIVDANIKECDKHGYSTNSTYTNGTELGTLEAN